MKSRKIISVFIVFTLVVLCFGCKMIEPMSIIRENGKTGYRDYYIDIPKIDGCISNVNRLFQIDNKFYADISYENTSNVQRGVYELTLDGFTNKILDVVPTAIDVLVYKNSCLIIEESKMELVDLSNNAVYMSLKNESGYYYSLFVDENLYLIANGIISQYDSNGHLLNNVANDNLMAFNRYCPIFEVDGDLFCVVDSNWSYNYYSVSFESGKISFVTNSNESNLDLEGCLGRYTIMNDGIYLFSPKSKNLSLLGEWSNIDMRPPLKAVNRSDLAILNNDCFARTYMYSDGDAEIQIYVYDESIDYSDCKEIILAGFSPQEDLAIQLAMYGFNTSQQEYRLRLIDYVEYPWSTAKEAEIVNASLIKEFSSDKAPDMLFGPYFDYEYLGRIGVVQNISKYVDDVLNTDDVASNIYELMSNNGICYKVFSSYCFDGFWARQRAFSSDDVSIYDLNELDTSASVYGSMYSQDIVDFIIRYNLNTIINRSGGTDLLTDDQIIDILNHSMKNGIPMTSQLEVLSTVRGIANNECVLARSFMYGVKDYAYYCEMVDEPLRFVGLPSIYGSSHMIVPNGIVAVMSSSDNLNACIEFLSYLFNEDVQRVLISNNRVPIMRSVVTEYLDCLKNKDITNYFYEELKDVDIDTKYLDSFDRILNSVDTMATYDWGLYNIICDEMLSHYTQGKEIDLIVVSLKSRLNLYVEEHYG